MPGQDCSPPQPTWFVQSLACFQEALELTDPEDAPGLYGIILHDIAELHLEIDDLQEAADRFRESISYKEKADNPSDLVITRIAYGDCLIRSGERTEARAVLDRTRDLLSENAGTIDSSRRAVRLHSLGQSFEALGARGQEGAYSEALAAYQEALGLLSAETDSGSYATVLENIGDVYQAQGNLQEARASYTKAVECMRHEEGAERRVAALLRVLGRVHHQIGKRATEAQADDQ